MCGMAGYSPVSGSKRLKRAVGYSGTKGSYSARRVRHKAIEQDISKWVGWVASTQQSSELSTTQAQYARGKEIKAMHERR